MSRPATFGVIIGNRGFFPAILARDGREEILRVLEKEGYGSVCLTPQDTKFGSVETLEDSNKCADLFRQHRGEIDGVLVSLPNFGDERAVVNSLRGAGLDVPVLVQAFPDEPNKMLISARRDSFCGKMSLCNNLWQYGIKYSLTTQHTESPTSPVFLTDLKAFAATCRIVKGLKNLRVGLLGARPTNFNTVRFSEKLLERQGISVETLDLSEVFGRIGRLADDDPKVKAKLESIQGYVPTEGVPGAPLVKMAKFGVVVDGWMKDNDLGGSAIQCWTAMEEFFGVVPCAVMSMMSNSLVPSACETDITGLIGMFVLQLAAGEPSAIVDWNNNYGEDPDKAVIFHCSNLPKHFFEAPKMDFQEIIAGSVGKANSFGTVVGSLKAGPLTYCRVSTDDYAGKIRAYCGEGEITSDRLQTFGGYGVVKIAALQALLQHICRQGYEHHVAVNRSHYGRAVVDALANYKGWEVYHHGA
jgi:L-fucose isomerase-like protein